MKVKPDVDRCALPFKGAVVIPQNNVQDRPVKQRLHLNLQGEKKKRGQTELDSTRCKKKKKNCKCKITDATHPARVRAAWWTFPTLFQRLMQHWRAIRPPPPPPPVPTSNQSFRDCINIYKHSVLMAAGIVCQRWPGAPRALCIFE